MDVIDGRTDPAQLSSSTAAVCVLLPPASIERAREFAPSLGVNVSAAEQLQRSTHRRPLAHVDGQRISVVAFATDAAGRSIEVHVHVGERGVLVRGPEEATGAIREAVAPVDGEPDDGLAAVLLAFARQSDEVIQHLSSTHRFRGFVRRARDRVALGPGRGERDRSALAHAGMTDAASAEAKARGSAGSDLTFVAGRTSAW